MGPCLRLADLSDRPSPDPLRIVAVARAWRKRSLIPGKTYKNTCLSIRPYLCLSVYQTDTCQSERGYEKYLPYVWHVIKVRGSLTAQRESQQQVMCPVEQAVYSVGQQSDPAGQESGLVGQDFPVGQERDASTKNPFELYFLRSWGNCRQLWCSYKRPNAVTLRKNTNNRLNASCKQIKDVVNSTMELDESVTSLMYCQSHAEKLLMDQVYKVSVVHLAKFIREIQYVPNLVSEHAWDLIYEQFIFAAGRISFKFYELMPGVYFIKCTVNVDDAMDEPNEEYFVTKKCCKCLFMSKGGDLLGPETAVEVPALDVVNSSTQALMSRCHIVLKQWDSSTKPSPVANSGPHYDVATIVY
ncbi:hypothetical protein GQ600_4833 [Phytophthora cactorum]|nr:hypothetical protein GQ600_4833 [Phytophthora cactorum]